MEDSSKDDGPSDSEEIVEVENGTGGPNSVGVVWELVHGGTTYSVDGISRESIIVTSSSPLIVEASRKVPGTVTVLESVPGAQVNLVKTFVGGTVTVGLVCEGSQSVKVMVVGEIVVGK